MQYSLVLHSAGHVIAQCVGVIDQPNVMHNNDARNQCVWMISVLSVYVNGQLVFRGEANADTVYAIRSKLLELCTILLSSVFKTKQA